MSINLSCHSKEHPKGTCFAARSDVGIRNLLVANSQKSVKIVRFGNRLPRQSADWLAMTGFFDSLCQREALTEGLSFRGRGRAPPLHTSADSLCAIRAGGCGHPPLRNHRRCMRHTHGRTDPSAPIHGFPAAKYFQTSGQRPPPTFAASRQRRDLIIATPGGCFQRGRAVALPLWSFQGDRIFKERGKSKSPFP